MASLGDTDTGSLAVFQRLPDELWLIILALCAYDQDLFSSTIEYGALATRRNPMPPAITSFALAFVHLNRRFSGMAVQVLWRYVVVCSPASLLLITTLAANYGQYTWRFELRLKEQYHLPTILDILVHMPNLRVFLNQNYSNRIAPVRRTNPEHVIQAICEFCPLLRRVQFDAEWEYPSLQQVRAVLNAKPALEALRICGLASDDSTVVENWEGRVPIRTQSSLHSLSLGASYWIMQTDHRERALASFLGMLTASDALPALTTVHLMENCSSSVRFLETYGRQLVSLLSLPPNQWSLRSWDYDIPQFTDLCPHLLHACWLFKDWHGMDETQPIPGYHPTLRNAEIVLQKIEIAVPVGYEDCMRTLLGCILRGQFPALKTVSFVANGGVTPDYAHSDWFAQMAVAFRNKNPTGVASVQDDGVYLCAP